MHLNVISTVVRMLDNNICTLPVAKKIFYPVRPNKKSYLYNQYVSVK